VTGVTGIIWRSSDLDPLRDVAELCKFPTPCHGELVESSNPVFKIAWTAHTGETWQFAGSAVVVVAV
jgi:hypothetical protein